MGGKRRVCSLCRLEGHNARTCPNKDLAARIRSNKRAKIDNDDDEEPNRGTEKTQPSQDLPLALKKSQKLKPRKKIVASISSTSEDNVPEDEAHKVAAAKGRQSHHPSSPVVVNKSPNLERARSSPKRKAMLPKKFSDMAMDMNETSTEEKPSSFADDVTEPKPPRFSFRPSVEEDNEDKKTEGSKSTDAEDQSSPVDGNVVHPEPRQFSPTSEESEESDKESTGSDKESEDSDAQDRPPASKNRVSQPKLSEPPSERDQLKKRSSKSRVPRINLKPRRKRLVEEEEEEIGRSLGRAVRQVKESDLVRNTNDDDSRANGEGDPSVGIARDHTILSSFEVLRSNDAPKVEEALCTLTSFCVLERQEDPTARAPSPRTCSQFESNQQKVLLMGGCHVIVQAMTKHPDSFKVQIESARLLTSFAELPNFPAAAVSESIGSAGAIAVVLQAIKNKWQSTSSKITTSNGSDPCENMRGVGIQCLRALTLQCPSNIRRLTSTKESILTVLEALKDSSKTNSRETIFSVCELLNNVVALGEKRVAESIVEADGLIALATAGTRQRANKATLQKVMATHDRVMKLHFSD